MLREPTERTDTMRSSSDRIRPRRRVPAGAAAARWRRWRNRPAHRRKPGGRCSATGRGNAPCAARSRGRPALHHHDHFAWRVEHAEQHDVLALKAEAPHPVATGRQLYRACRPQAVGTDFFGGRLPGRLDARGLRPGGGKGGTASTRPAAVRTIRRSWQHRACPANRPSGVRSNSNSSPLPMPSTRTAIMPRSTTRRQLGRSRRRLVHRPRRPGSGAPPHDIDGAVGGRLQEGGHWPPRTGSEVRGADHHRHAEQADHGGTSTKLPPTPRMADRIRSRSPARPAGSALI